MSNDNEMKYPGEEHHYGQGPQIGWSTTQNFGSEPDRGKLHSPTTPKRNGWQIATLIVSVIAIIAIIAAVLAFTRLASSTSAPTSTATPLAQQPTSTHAVTIATPTLSPTTTAQTSTPASNNYAAIQPGPGCDTNGGTWLPQGVNNIACGTTITNSAPNSQAYLYFQLPNNEGFASKNKLSIAGGNLAYLNSYNCIGLAEQNATTGILVDYCGNGKWYIYSISNTGAIIKTLQESVTSTRATEVISLALQDTSLSFSIDAETHTISIAPIQPTKIAIAVFETSGNGTLVNNFSYTTMPA
jgi:hypothetical protein